ncbi:AAA family ATPase, partial [Mycobacterium tuberculosis]
MIRVIGAGDDAVGAPPACGGRSDGVGVRPHKWEVPPPACG